MGSESSFNEESSDEICKALNKNHANNLLALVVSSTKNVSPTQVNARKISASTLTISYVECQGTMCTLNSVDISFSPPIKPVADAIDRVVKEGESAMEAQCMWLVTEPLPLLILMVVATLGYVALVMGENGIESAIDSIPFVEKIISFLFGSYFFIAVKSSFYFSIVAHSAEALYIAIMFRARTTLGYWACLKWFALICCVGYPLTKKALLFTNQPKEDKLD